MTSTSTTTLEQLSDLVRHSPSPLDRSDALVRSTMARLGVSLAPEVFQFEVARAYETIATGTTPPGLIEPLLRSCHSYPVFRAALRHAGPAKRVLILGCGEGLPGLDSEYASEEWLREWPDTITIDRTGVSLPLLLDDSAWRDDTYDVVITHSLAHFVYRLDLLFARIEQILRPDGVYVMGKEVNAAFGRVPALLEATADLDHQIFRARRRRALFDIKRYYRGLGARLGIDRPMSWSAGVNLVLVRRLGLTDDLTATEQSRLIEVHRPLLPNSPLQIGMQGFDVSTLSNTFLKGFSLTWFGSSGYLGYHHCRDWPAEWRRRNEELESYHKDSGIYFSASWRLEG